MTNTNETIQIPVADGTSMQARLSRPVGQPAPAGVIVAHELFGVNPDIGSAADALARDGYLTIAPEFYHRDAPPGRWLARDEAGRREGFSYLDRLSRPHALADARVSYDWLLAQPGITKIAMVGFSAGGHLAYLAACQLPIFATAILYGGWLPTTDIPMSQPTPTLALTPGITGRILYLVGADDALIDAGSRGQIARALAASGVDHELVTYPGTAHAFFWPGTDSFSQPARDDAWSRIRAMLAAPCH